MSVDSDTRECEASRGVHRVWVNTVPNLVISISPRCSNGTWEVPSGLPALYQDGGSLGKTARWNVCIYWGMYVNPTVIAKTRALLCSRGKVFVVTSYVRD